MERLDGGWRGCWKGRRGVGRSWMSSDGRVGNEGVRGREGTKGKWERGEGAVAG